MLFLSVERPREQVHGPGTLDDLLEDAREAGYEISRRTVHDWISLGLLDNPQRRGAGRGSRPGQHSANQRKLFLLLLSKRVEMPKIPSLALLPFGIWLWWGEEWVPTRQALKAFRAWFGDGLRRKQVCLEAARATLEQIDHPAATDTARNRFVRLFAEVGYRGSTTPELRSELEDAARAVFEPPSSPADSAAWSTTCDPPPRHRAVSGRRHHHPRACKTALIQPQYTLRVLEPVRKGQGSRTFGPWLAEFALAEAIERGVLAGFEIDVLEIEDPDCFVGLSDQARRGRRLTLLQAALLEHARGVQARTRLLGTAGPHLDGRTSPVRVIADARPKTSRQTSTP